MAGVFYPTSQAPHATIAAVALFVVLLALLAGCALPEQPPAPEALFETQGPPVRIVQFDASGRAMGAETVFTLVKNDAGWRRVLSPRQFAVLRQGVTELPDPSADV